MVCSQKRFCQMPRSRCRRREAETGISPPPREPLHGEQPFDAGPPAGITRIAFRQLPRAVQMFRQQNDGHQLEGPLVLHHADRAAQARPRPFVSKEAPAPLRHDREKEHPTGPKSASIFRHRPSLTMIDSRWWAIAHPTELFRPPTRQLPENGIYCRGGTWQETRGK